MSVFVCIVCVLRAICVVGDVCVGRIWAFRVFTVSLLPALDVACVVEPWNVLRVYLFHPWGASGCTVGGHRGGMARSCPECVPMVGVPAVAPCCTALVWRFT